MLKIASKQLRKVRKKVLEAADWPDDHCLAITLYTMEDTPRENSLYFQMNKALRAQDRSAVRPWRDFVWLLLHNCCAMHCK